MWCVAQLIVCVVIGRERLVDETEIEPTVSLESIDMVHCLHLYCCCTETGYDAAATHSYIHIMFVQGDSDVICVIAPSRPASNHTSSQAFV